MSDGGTARARRRPELPANANGWHRTRGRIQTWMTAGQRGRSVGIVGIFVLVALHVMKGKGEIEFVLGFADGSDEVIVGNEMGFNSRLKRVRLGAGQGRGVVAIGSGDSSVSRREIMIAKEKAREHTLGQGTL